MSSDPADQYADAAAALKALAARCGSSAPIMTYFAEHIAPHEITCVDSELAPVDRAVACRWMTSPLLTGDLDRLRSPRRSLFSYSAAYMAISPVIDRHARRPEVLRLYYCAVACWCVKIYGGGLPEDYLLGSLAEWLLSGNDEQAAVAAVRFMWSLVDGTDGRASPTLIYCLAACARLGNVGTPQDVHVLRRALRALIAEVCLGPVADDSVDTTPTERDVLIQTWFPERWSAGRLDRVAQHSD